MPWSVPLASIASLFLLAGALVLTVMEGTTFRFESPFLLVSVVAAALLPVLVLACGLSRDRTTWWAVIACLSVLYATVLLVSSPTRIWFPYGKFAPRWNQEESPLLIGVMIATPGVLGVAAANSGRRDHPDLGSLPRIIASTCGFLLVFGLVTTSRGPRLLRALADFGSGIQRPLDSYCLLFSVLLLVYGATSALSGLRSWSLGGALTWIGRLVVIVPAVTFVGMSELADWLMSHPSRGGTLDSFGSAFVFASVWALAFLGLREWIRALAVAATSRGRM